MEDTAAASAALQELTRTLLTEQHRFWRRLFNLPRVVQLACETRVGTTPHEVVLENGTHKLLRYRGDSPARYAEPVLFCYALINRPYILDLQPDKSVVRHYLDRGFDVYMIDWGVPTASDRGLTLEHYVCGFLRDAVRWIGRAHRREDVHLLGYCMGGTMAALFAAWRPEAVRTLTLLASPIDFGRRESLLNVWADVQRFDVDAFIDAHGNCPGWFLQTCFQCTNPIQNVFGKNLAFCEQLDDPRAIVNFFAMERWINDNIPVAGETFREFVKKLYQRNELVRGQFQLGEQHVDLQRIACPLLLLTARNDQLVPPSSTEGIRPHVASREIESMSLDAGHVGLVVSGKAQHTLWPAASRWLAQHSSQV